MCRFGLKSSSYHDIVCNQMPCLLTWCLATFRYDIEIEIERFLTTKQATLQVASPMAVAQSLQLPILQPAAWPVIEMTEVC